MARNGSGVYSLPSGNPFITGTVISSTTVNNTLSDIASALTQSVSADGQTPMTGNLAMGGGKLTGMGTGSVATDSITVGQVQAGTFIYVGTVGGTGDVITLTASPAIASYVAGQTFRFVSSAANTTNVTVNVSNLGAKAVTKNGTTALIGGDIPSGALITITYDGTQFQMTGVVGNLALSSLVALLASANTFTTDPQTISNTTAGAGGGPLLYLYRNKAGSNSDLIGQYVFDGQNSTPIRVTYAYISGFISSNTPGAETGRIRVYTKESGSDHIAAEFESGMNLGTPTGGFKGDGTGNAANGWYDNGRRVTSSNSVLQSTATTLGANPLIKVYAHGLGYIPSIYRAVLQNITPELGYSAGDEVDATFSFFTNDQFITMVADATNVTWIQSGNYILSNKSTGANSNITLANWQVRIRVWP